MDYSILSKATLFQGLSSEMISKSLDKIFYRIKKYKAGSLIASSGEKVDRFQLILEGTVKGEMVDIAGRVIKIEDIPPSGALAPAFMFGNRNSYPVNVISVTDSTILVIERLEFLKLLTTDSRLLVNFLDMISNRSQFLSDKIKFLNFKTIRGKLSQMILQKAGSGKLVSMGMTQQELADYFGVARPSVARAISSMEEDGIIKFSRKNVEILRKDKLMLLVAE
ncbi:MAG: Crp/Fnr family transcriptional regulator [Bacteroidales bacterium]